MQQDLVSMKVSKELQAQILELIKQIHDKLPELIALPPGERRSLNIMGPRSERYARLAMTSAQQNPEILPRGVDLQAAVDDLEAMDNLIVVLKALQQLTQLVEDTVSALGSDVMCVANLVYGMLQSVGKSAGLEEVVKELSYRHARSRKKKPTPESEPEPGQ